MLRMLTLGCTAAALLVAPVPAYASSQPAPSEKITVNVVTINGSGCRAGTAAVVANQDNTAFTVTYKDYVAKDGADAKPTEFRKNCQLSLLVDVPQGFTYAIARADYYGDVHLSKGATAQQNAYYYFMGSTPTAEVSTSFSGPATDDWHITDAAQVASLVYAPCGERVNLNINTELRVNAGSAEKSKNSISMDSTKGSVRTVYHLSWKRCD